MNRTINQMIGYKAKKKNKKNPKINEWVNEWIAGSIDVLMKWMAACYYSCCSFLSSFAMWVSTTCEWVLVNMRWYHAIIFENCSTFVVCDEDLFCFICSFCYCDMYLLLFYIICVKGLTEWILRKRYHFNCLSKIRPRKK